MPVLAFTSHARCCGVTAVTSVSKRLRKDAGLSPSCQSPAKGKGARVKATERAKLRLLLVDDHALFREGLARLLETQSDFQVIGTTGTVSLALEMLGPSRPDVVLLDVDLGPQRA